MAVRVILTVDIKRGEEAEFEREFQDVARRVRGAAGMLGQTLCRDTNAASRYIVVSDWSNREQFRQFETSPEQDEATAPVRKHRSSVQMHVYDVVFDGEGPRGHPG